MKRITKTFLDLVQIDSPSGEEEAVRDYLVQHLSKLGLGYYIDESGNLFSKIEGESEPLLLCAHMDTVEPGREIKPIVDKGIIKSSGNTILGADNKVAIAAILEALYRIENRSLEILFTVREETNGGINDFDFSQLNSRYGLIADRSSPIGSIVLSSPWIVDLKIALRGRSAHAAKPEEGINTFNALFDIFSKHKPGRLDEDTTFNIGLINGGDASNTVPEKITLEGELRSFNKKRLGAYINDLTSFSENIDDDVRFDLKKIPYGSGYKYIETDTAIQKVVYSMKSIGIEPYFEKSFGGSDVNALVANGISAVNIGDGSKFSHTTKEQISIDDLELLGELIFEYINID